MDQVEILLDILNSRLSNSCPSSHIISKKGTTESFLLWAAFQQRNTQPTFTLKSQCYINPNFHAVLSLLKGLFCRVFVVVFWLSICFVCFFLLHLLSSGKKRKKVKVHPAPKITATFCVVLISQCFNISTSTTCLNSFCCSQKPS